MDSKNMEVAEILLVSVMKPWVRCPPWGKSRPITRSWGFNRPGNGEKNNPLTVSYDSGLLNVIVERVLKGD